MATNKSTIEALERMSEIIEELAAFNKSVLKHHITAQKKQDGKYPNDSYPYDKDKKTVRRKREVRWKW